MPENLPRPEPERVSALTALVLLTYGLIRMIVLPSVEAEIAVLGLMVKFVFRTQTMMLTLASALAVAGTDWLIQSHPQRKQGQRTMENWVVPALAAIALGVIVIRLPEGPPLWIGLFLGALLLIAIFTAEFIVSYADDPRYDGVATAILALAFLLLTGSLYSISALQLRAIFAVPLLTLASLAITWRLLRLAFPERRVESWAILIAIMVAQIALGLHYWPIPPLRVSLILALCIYQIYLYVQSHLRQEIRLSSLMEQAGLGIFALVLIFLFT
jgi:hypothetical protein